MFNAKRTALCVALGAMALAAGEASAGCKYIPNPPGTYVCANWIKGSEICDITTSATGTSNPTQLDSVTCSITGVVFIDGAEGAPFSDANGAYCASGYPPAGVCWVGTSSFVVGDPVQNIATKKGKPLKSSPAQKCHDHGGKHFGKNVGHVDCSITIPGGNPVLSEESTDVECHPTAYGPPGTVDCTASAEITPPGGTTCPNGQLATDFTASAMLAITEACVGSVCEKIYDFCTVDPFAVDGTPYDCIDITDQGQTCSATNGYLTFDPDDPRCGTQRTCID